jgi:hypothetical protein
MLLSSILLDIYRAIIPFSTYTPQMSHNFTNYLNHIDLSIHGATTNVLITNLFVLICLRLERRYLLLMIESAEYIVTLLRIITPL